MTNAVEIHGLTKKFGRSTALDGLDLTVAPGDVTGFLGPNGAGKSTTIRILLGLLRADTGTVRLLGGEPWHDAVALHRRIAYVPGDVTLWPNLTGAQAIDFLARLRGGSVDTRRRDELIRRFELDPLMEKNFQQCVAEVADRGAAVLLSSHILAEVEKLCDTVTIIRDGRTVRSGTLTELRHLMRTTVTARIRGDAAQLHRLPFVHDFSAHDGQISFSVDRADLDATMDRLAGLGIDELAVAPASLEDLFLREYQGVS